MALVYVERYRRGFMWMCYRMSDKIICRMGGGGGGGGQNGVGFFCEKG